MTSGKRDASLVVSVAPAPVAALTLQSDGSQDSLKASWIPAVGHVDCYQLSLSPSGSSDPALTLPQNTSQWVFRGLTPGNVYQVSVKTKSGELTTETSMTGRTGKNYGKNMESGELQFDRNHLKPLTSGKLVLY